MKRISMAQKTKQNRKKAKYNNIQKTIAKQQGSKKKKKKDLRTLLTLGSGPINNGYAWQQKFGKFLSCNSDFDSNSDSLGLPAAHRVVFCLMADRYMRLEVRLGLEIYFRLRAV